jgi:hypothetical protein
VSRSFPRQNKRSDGRYQIQTSASSLPYFSCDIQYNAR